MRLLHGTAHTVIYPRVTLNLNMDFNIMDVLLDRSAGTLITVWLLFHILL